MLGPILNFIYCYYSRLPWPDLKTFNLFHVGGIMTEKKIVDNCPAREKINTYCSCPKTDCERHGICCECIVAHKERKDAAFHIKFPHCLRDQLTEIGYKP